MDLRGLSSITDYFVICSGTSLPHLKAIRREIADRLREEHELRANSTDGELESRWLVLDFGDVLVFESFHQDQVQIAPIEVLHQISQHRFILVTIFPEQGPQFM